MSRKTIKTTCLIAIVIVSVLSAICLLPSQALAKSLSEYDAEIATQEEKLAEKQAQLEEKQELLSQVVRTVYRDYSTTDLLSIIMSEQDLSSVLTQIDYAYQLSDHYRKAVDEVQEAKIVLEETLHELDTMRAERQSRAASADKAALIQYSQSGEEWSNLPYWGVSISYAGCGLCAYTSIIDILTDSDYTPADMLDIRGDWAGMDHYPDDCTGTPDGSTHEEFTKAKFDLDMYEIDTSTQDLADELSKGGTAAMMLVHGVSLKKKSGGSWWSSGHFIACYAYDSEGFHVHDSASSYGEGQNVIYSWDEMDALMSGTSRIVMYSN